MDPALAFVLYLLALICFVLAAIGVPVHRTNLVALGLAFFALAWVIQTAQAAF
jgi:hypothetical protein